MGKKTKEKARFLFDAIDIDMSETLEGRELVETLLGLGITESHDIIVRTLEQIFSTKNLNEVSITFSEFIRLFKSD
jgi:Ca2+-binding EF-hand superfamily protein